MKINKIIFTIFIVLFFLLFGGIDVFADWLDNNQNKFYINSSLEIIELSTGAKLPHWYEFEDKRDNGKQKRAYLFKTMEDEIKEITLFDGEPAYTRQYGQWIYFPVNNNGNPLNLDPLKDPNNAMKQFEVSSNITDEAWGYVNKYGQKFYTKFPNNAIIPTAKRGAISTNFKVETINVPTKVFTNPKTQAGKQFFMSADGSNLLGNVRNVWSHTGSTTGFFQFAPDNLSNPTAGWRIYPANRLIKYPHQDQYGLKLDQGYYNELAKTLTTEEKNANNSIWKNITNTYAVLRAEYPLLRERMIELGASSTDFESQVEKFLEYAELQFLSAIDSPGVAFVKGNMGNSTNPDIWLADLISPEIKLSEVNNLRVGSEQYKIGDNYNIKLVNPETNKILDPKIDRLIVGKKYIVDYHVAFDTTKPSKERTNNAPILTNVFLYYNTNNNLNNADTAFHNIVDINGLPFLEKANKTNNPLNTSKFEEENMDISKIANYKQEIEVLATTKDGIKTNKIKVCAVLPYQYDFYKSFNGDATKGDNDDLTDDMACLEFEIDNQVSNTLVGHSPNNAVVNHNGKNYDRVEVRRYNETTGALENEVLNNGSDLTAILKAGEKIKVTTYVQRADLPKIPSGNENPITINQIGLIMNENINNQVLPINLKENSTIYKNNFTRIAPQLTEVALTSQGAFEKYNPSIHGTMKFEAGTVLKYEIDYTVPTTEMLFSESSSKYNGYYSAVSRGFEKWSVLMELRIYNQNSEIINSIKTDDWGKFIANIIKAEPNISILELSVYDENGSFIGKAYRSSDGRQITQPEKLRLDPNKNYYIEGKTQYTYEVDGVPKQSTNSNLRTIFSVSYNGLTPPNIENNTFYGESELKGKWNHNAIGTYTPRQLTGQSSVNVSNYYPNASNYLPSVKVKPDGVNVAPWNPMILPIKYLNVTEGWITAKVPSMYSNNDNIRKEPLQEVTIPFVVDGCIDNAITNIQLFDSKNREYKKENGDGTYSLNPSETYSAKITIERLEGTGDPVDIQEAINTGKFKVQFKENQDGFGSVGKGQMSIQGNSKLEKVGDKVVVEVKTFTPSNGYLEITAILDRPDCRVLNNTKNQVWLGYLNFAVAEFIVQPERLSPEDCEATNKKTAEFTPSWSAVFTLTNFVEDTNGTLNINVSDVPIQIKASNGSVVFEDVVSFTGSGDRVVVRANGNFQNSASKMTLAEGAHPFTIAINGGKTGSFNSRKYPEMKPDKKPYEDNEATSAIIVDACPHITEACEQDCEKNHTKNNWTQTFQMTTRENCSAESYTTTCCSGTAPNRVCTPKTAVRCVGCTTRYWDTTPSFTEEFKTRVMFRSLTTVSKFGSAFQDITANPDRAVVRAGQWYEFYVETHFFTTREEQSTGYGRTPPAYSKAPYSSSCGGSSACHWQRRSPGQSSIPNVTSIHMNLTGYGQPECYPAISPYYTSGAWSNQTKRFRPPTGTDIMNETNTRRYIPVSGRNGTLELSVVTKSFNGYISDDGGDYGSGHPDYDNQRSRRSVRELNPKTGQYEWKTIVEPPYQNALQSCTKTRIYIIDPLPIGTQIIGE